MQPGIASVSDGFSTGGPTRVGAVASAGSGPGVVAGRRGAFPLPPSVVSAAQAGVGGPAAAPAATLVEGGGV